MDALILLSWYDENHRSLPWRSTRTPYGTWISEAMLQQTRVTTVIDYYKRFMILFPTIEALANASEDEVYKAWEGLGYYSRARNLQRCARECVERFHGNLPDNVDDLLSLSGIGPYMAGAIASQAFNKVVPAVDGNAVRIYTRLLALPLYAGDSKTNAEIASRIEKDIDPDRPGDFNQALMDLGAGICTPKSPKCDACPFETSCEANLLGLASDFPKQREKKKVPVYPYTIVKLIFDDGIKHVCVRKRPSTGLLANLYELISFPGHLDEASLRIALIHHTRNTTIVSVRRLTSKTHVFSHLKWDMIGYEVVVQPQKNTDRAIMFFDQGHDRLVGYRYVNEEEYAELAFPSALRNYV